MATMRIIPVIDLLGGVVVRGVAGNRESYRPIESRLACDVSPEDVARAIHERFRLDTFYVADLDAIAGAEPAWDIYWGLAPSAASLWIDAGLADSARAHRLAGFVATFGGESRVICGLESLPDAGSLAEFIAIVGAERLVFSLDLKQGRPLSTISAWREAGAEEIAAEALEAGVRRMIVLDLAQVGVYGGAGALRLCETIRGLDPGLELITGGGVRSLADIQTLANVGCDAVLVASALHDGRITPGDLARFARKG